MATSPNGLVPLIPSVATREALLELLLTATVEATTLDRDELLAPRRAGLASDARHAIWYVLREDHHWTLVEVGKAFDRDHSTVTSGVRSARHRLSGGDQDTIYLVAILRAVAAPTYPEIGVVAMAAALRELTRRTLETADGLRRMAAGFHAAIDEMDDEARAVLHQLEAEDCAPVVTRNGRSR